MRSLNNPAAIEAWDDAYSWVDECDRREVERNKPQPIITPVLLIAFALAAYAVMLAVFGTEPF